MSSPYVALFPGDPAPWFRQRCTTASGDYTFDMAAGRHVVLFLFGSSTHPGAAAGLATVRARRALFDDRQASFFGVSADPADANRLRADPPGLRCFLDADGTVGRLFGARPLDGASTGGRDLWLVLDPLLRVQAVALDDAGMAGQVLDFLQRQPLLGTADGAPAPALMLSAVFEPEFCQRLAEYHRITDSRPSGVFTQRAGGATEAIVDTGFKRRRDCDIRDRTLVEQCQARIIRRVLPELRKAFQFDATEMERLILAEYSSEDRGCFGAHRDNTVTATAHRRFAVSINLNDEFEGGELVFPEFSQRRHRPLAGGALVFSCSLLHLVTPVTAGRRLACLPFVYDQPAATLKRANLAATRSPDP